MTVFVVLLRAINLGAKRRVPMAELRAALEEAGSRDVTTHLQSGNVVLRSRVRDADAVGRSVEKLVRAHFKLDVDVMVRTADELATVGRTNPLRGRGVDPGTLHVCFLKSRPLAAAGRALAEADFGRDRFELRGREVYLHHPNGLARSKMSLAFFERTLGVPGTVRTWKVVTKLVELAATPGR